jgi:hypothetical protein
LLNVRHCPPPFVSLLMERSLLEDDHCLAPGLERSAYVQDCRPYPCRRGGIERPRHFRVASEDYL